MTINVREYGNSDGFHVVAVLQWGGGTWTSPDKWTNVQAQPDPYGNNGQRHSLAYSLEAADLEDFYDYSARRYDSSRVSRATVRPAYSFHRDLVTNSSNPLVASLLAVTYDRAQVTTLAGQLGLPWLVDPSVPYPDHGYPDTGASPFLNTVDQAEAATLDGRLPEARVRTADHARPTR